MYFTVQSMSSIYGIVYFEPTKCNNFKCFDFKRYDIDDTVY